MIGQMTAKFTSAEAWYAGIAAAVEAGLTFEARESGDDRWVIIYTGGY